MAANVWALLVACSLLLSLAGQSWQDKAIPTWSEDDARQVLNDSPWAKAVTPKITKPVTSDQNRGNGNMAQIGGAGIGMPGMGGMGRRGGMRNPAGSGTESASTTPSNTPPKLTVRWESALPVQAAELKAREVNAPAMDEDHYAIAVYGIPSRMLNYDSQGLSDELKGQAQIKREGKKDLKPSSVEVLPADDGTVVVYYFPRSKEISKRDKDIGFEAQIARLQLSVTFNVDSMVYQTKLEL